jgi:hypothetical protein
MLSEFGHPYDIELTGHGAIGLSFEEWGNCLRLAKAFGWQPAGTVSPVADTQCARTEGQSVEWDGNYASKDLQQVTDADAMALSAALRTGVRAWERIEGLTIHEFDAVRRVPKSFESYVDRVADYAARGKFFIQ